MHSETISTFELKTMDFLSPLGNFRWKREKGKGQAGHLVSRGVYSIALAFRNISPFHDRR